MTWKIYHFIAALPGCYLCITGAIFQSMQKLQVEDCMSFDKWGCLSDSYNVVYGFSKKRINVGGHWGREAINFGGSQTKETKTIFWVRAACFTCGAVLHAFCMNASNKTAPLE